MPEIETCAKLRVRNAEQAAEENHTEALVRKERNAAVIFAYAGVDILLAVVLVAERRQKRVALGLYAGYAAGKIAAGKGGVRVPFFAEALHLVGDEKFARLLLVEYPRGNAVLAGVGEIVPGVALIAPVENFHLLV